MEELEIMVQYVKIFAVCARGDNSGVAASEDLEKKINAFFKRNPNLKLVTLQTIMNSSIAWTEMSATGIYEGQINPLDV